jgi:hypothetical protein
MANLLWHTKKAQTPTNFARGCEKIYRFFLKKQIDMFFYLIVF